MKKTASTIDYMQLFQSLPTAHIVFSTNDPTFTIIEENQSHADIANVNRADSIGRPLLEVFPDVSDEYLKKGKSLLLESIRRVIKNGVSDTIPDLHYDIKDSDGTMRTRYWRVTHYPLFDDDKLIAIFQATEDTTDVARAQQSSQTSQYHLEQLLKVGNIGTWVWDTDTSTITSDRNTAKLFGFDEAVAANGLPSKDYLDAVHPDDKSRVMTGFRTAIRRHLPYECEYRALDADGDVHWVIARGFFEETGGGKKNQSPGIIIDITERKRAEENLNFLTKATTQFSASLGYKEILHAITNMVVPTTADWCTIDLLEDGELHQVALAHKDPEKVKWAKELRKKQGPPNLDEPTGIAKVIRTGEVEYYPTITREMIEASTKNEEELKLMLELGFSSVIIAPLTLDGKTIGALTFVATESRVHYKQSDVEVAKALASRATLAVYNASLYEDAKRELKYRRKLQSDLEDLNEQLEKRVVERTTELQTTNKGLKREIIRRKQTEKVLDASSKELTRSNQELQDFAYVASHDLQEPLRKIQAFGDLLESEFGQTLGQSGKEYLGRMRNAASRMSILIEDLLAFSRVTTRARPNESVDLNQVASEVIGDLEQRIQSTNGIVTIENLPMVCADRTHMRQLFQNLIGNALKFHKPDVPPQVKVYIKPVKAGDSMQTICFEDNGIGFEEKYLDRIFSVFQRLHGKDEYEGTGIGLAACRKVAERYGGTITATSKKDQGSIFSFSIPIKGEDSTNE